MSSTAPLSESRGHGRIAWALIGLALGLRLAVVAIAPRTILWPDGLEFEAIGRNLLLHGSYGLQTLRPPGYPTLIAIVYRIFGPHLLALRLIEVVLGTVSVAVIGFVGRRLFGVTAGLIALALAAIHPVLALLPATQFSENLLVLVLVLALAAAFSAWRERSLARWALAGVCFGLAVLVRPNAVLLLPGLAVGFAFALRRERRPWIGAALACAAALVLTVSPWIVRNHAVHHRWYFVATGGGRQFWFGNNERASGASGSLTLPDSTMRVAMSTMPDDAARERYLYGQGLRFVRTHPGRATQLYLIKLGNLFALFPETYSRTAFLNPLSRAAQGLASVVIFLGALLALGRLTRSPAMWPMVGAVISFALANAVFFTVMRYRLAFEPCLLWMAGAGWAPLFERWRRISR